MPSPDMKNIKPRNLSAGQKLVAKVAKDDRLDALARQAKWTECPKCDTKWPLILDCDDGQSSTKYVKWKCSAQTCGQVWMDRG